MSTYILICILLLFITTYFTRMLPFLFCKSKIKNKFLRSLLAYLPYAVLTSMIFPEVFEISGMGLIPAIIGFLVAVITSFMNKNLITVLATSTAATLVMMLINPYIMSAFGY